MPTGDRRAFGALAADPPRFDDFVAARSAHLLRVAYLLTRDWASAEDLLQTALTRAWSRVTDDPEPYVRRILVNAYASSWRRRWRGELPAAVLPDEADAGRAGHPELIADRELVWHALGRLQRRPRAVVVLRYFEDLTEAQVADALRISVGTVKSQTSKALAQLRVDPTLAVQPTDERS